MRITSTFTKTFALAAAGLLALTACTNASETSGSGAATSGAAAPSFDPTTIAKDEALAALVPEDIRSRGTLTFGSDTSYAPAEFLGPDNQTPVGYDVDMAKAIGAVLGLEVEVQTAEFTGILPALGTKYDLGISSFTINEERLSAVNMVSYFQAGTAWAVKAGNPSNFSFEDICGRSVGVQTGTVQEDPDLSERNAECLAAGKEAIDIVTLKAQTDITTRLVNGSIDAMAADSPIVGYAISQTGGQLERFGDTYDAAPQGIAVAKEDEDMAELVQQVVTKLIEDGSYTQILETWGVADGAVTESQVNPAV